MKHLLHAKALNMYRCLIAWKLFIMVCLVVVEN